MYHDLPMRMVIVDQRVALLILPRTLEGQDVPTGVDAVLVYESPLLRALERLFRSIWSMAIPAQAALTAAGDSSERDQQVLQLLASGVPDAAIGRALGVSERTVARYVRDLQERLGAPTRFLLGVRAAQRGLL